MRIPICPLHSSYQFQSKFKAQPRADTWKFTWWRDRRTTWYEQSSPTYSDNRRRKYWRQLNASPAVKSVDIPISGSRHDISSYIRQPCCTLITHTMNAGATLHHLTYHHIKDRHTPRDKLKKKKKKKKKKKIQHSIIWNTAPTTIDNRWQDIFHHQIIVGFVTRIFMERQ